MKLRDRTVYETGVSSIVVLTGCGLGQFAAAG